jgi:hypothetical protein
MPLVIVLFVGILAFGFFDLTLGRPLPVPAVLPSTPDASDNTPRSVDLPSIKTAAATQVAHCEPHDTACQLLALYHFVVTTVSPESRHRPWLHVQQHPARTLFMKSGDPLDIALLLSSLLDQRHIRNYLIVLPRQSYVLACDILPSALHQAGGIRPPVSPTGAPNRPALTIDPTMVHPAERIDAYAVHVSDAPCPCLLLDPSAPATEQPGDSLPVPADHFRYAIDVNGQRHGLVYAGL